MLTIYQPTNFAHTVVALLFYGLMLGLTVYSFLALYALNRFGHSKLIAVSVSVVYLIIIGSVYAVAQTNLDKIRF